MLTRNAKNIIRCAVLGVKSNDYGDESDNFKVVCANNNTDQHYMQLVPNLYFNNKSEGFLDFGNYIISSNYYYSGVPYQSAVLYLSSNDETPTEYDYEIKDPIVSSFTLTSLSNSLNIVNGVKTYTKTYTITATKSITIKSFGIVRNIEVSTSSSSTSNAVYISGSYINKTVLLYRALLDTPLTLGAGQSGTLTITISQSFNI